EAVAVNLRGRSFTIAAGVEVTDTPSGALFSQGTLLGGHLLAIVDGKLRYTYNWLGEDIQRVTAPVQVTAGRHVFSAQFDLTGQDDASPSPVGTLKLFLDDQELAEATIRTQPGKFGLGSGLTVGRALAPCADPELDTPATFTGGVLDAVVIDVSGEPWINHDAELAAWLAHD
ncbi:MAG: arylsulfatase, partial [Microthrixaceae bacterium]